MARKMTDDVWQAHVDHRTLYHSVVMLNWAVRRFIVMTGLPKLAKKLGIR